MKKLVYILAIPISFVVISCSSSPPEEQDTRTSFQIYLAYRMLTNEDEGTKPSSIFADLELGDKLPITTTINSANEIAYDFTSLGLKDEHTDGYLLDVHFFTDNVDGTIPMQTIKVRGETKTWTVSTDYNEYADPTVSTTWGQFVLPSNTNLYKQTVTTGMQTGGNGGSIVIADATATGNQIKRVTVHIHYNYGEAGKPEPGDFVTLQGQVDDGTGELVVVGTNKNGVQTGEGEDALYSPAP